MADIRPLHLHTIETLCLDLISGRPIGVGPRNDPLVLDQGVSRSILYWYHRNRGKWARQVALSDVEDIVTAGAAEPPTLSEGTGPSRQNPRKLKVTQIRAHRFAGIHAYGTEREPPEDFVFKPSNELSLFEGRNGSGKTSLVNALVWCLTGFVHRPQRPPEMATEEFKCRLARNPTGGTPHFTEHRLTPITPLPSPERYQPGIASEVIPADTWVELTLVDDSEVSTTVRRSQFRKRNGTLTEQTSGFELLGIDPAALHIGTAMPAIIPHLRLGSQSAMGRAVSRLTGLSELTDLSRHATRVKARLEGELTKRRKNEIAQLEARFLEHRNDLQKRIEQFSAMAPSDAAPLPGEEQLEARLLQLTNHFESCKAKALSDAEKILGKGFNPTDPAARADLEANIGPARGALAGIRRLPTAVRLKSLGSLLGGELDTVEAKLVEIRRQAGVLAELRANPSFARRKQLYARVAAWMQDGDLQAVLKICPVCESDISTAIDSTTGQTVVQHLSEALGPDADVVGQTIDAWVQSTMGALARELPAALKAELDSEMPGEPQALVRKILVDELFLDQCFRGALAPLRVSAEQLCDEYLTALPGLPATIHAPLPVDGATGTLNTAVRRLTRAIAISRWRKSHDAEVTAASKHVIGTASDQNTATSGQNPHLTGLVVALQMIVDGAAPINAALDLCARMTGVVAQRRKAEASLSAYATTTKALEAVISLGVLAQEQVESLRAVLQDRTLYWYGNIYRSAHTTAHDLLEVEIESRGALGLVVGRGGASAPAQHLNNASALRANLLAFFLAFWEHVLESRGGLRLLILDDPQELLDNENRERLARILPVLVEKGAQLIVTTNDHVFARKAAQHAKKEVGRSVEFRSVSPVVFEHRGIGLPAFTDALDDKRSEFEKQRDVARPAQDYVAEVRVFAEARLAELFEEPAYAAPLKEPTFSDLMGRLRGKVAQKSDFFTYPAVSQLASDKTFSDGSPCVALLNRAHHRDKDTITYGEVSAIANDLKKLHSSVLNVHEEFRRWRLREPLEPSLPEVVALDAIDKPAFAIDVHRDLAAFVSGSAGGQVADVEDDQLSGSWFEQKALFYVDCDNFGFSAPRGSLVVVEVDSGDIEDGRLVIAIHKGEVLARRLFRAQDERGNAILAAQPPDPRKNSPTRSLPLRTLQIHRVVGILLEAPNLAHRTKGEALQVGRSALIEQIEIGFRVRADSALPLALDGQIVLGGKALLPSELGSHEGKLAAIALEDGGSVLKRVSAALPGGLGHVRQFESIGGLGDSLLIQTEVVEGQRLALPVMTGARLVLGVLYR